MLTDFSDEADTSHSCKRRLPAHFGCFVSRLTAEALSERSAMPACAQCNQKNGISEPISVGIRLLGATPWDPQTPPKSASMQLLLSPLFSAFSALLSVPAVKPAPNAPPRPPPHHRRAAPDIGAVVFELAAISWIAGRCRLWWQFSKICILNSPFPFSPPQPR